MLPPIAPAPAIAPPSPLSFHISVLLDRNEDGTIRKTRNGYYRFTLCFKDSNNVTAATIRGFRITPPFMRLQPPMSQWRDTIYTFIELRPDLEAAIIAAVQAEIAVIPPTSSNALSNSGQST